MVSEQFDRCHGTLLQYVEFLCSALTPASAYAQMIPSLDDLVHLYHLDPEVCRSCPSETFVFLFYFILFFLSSLMLYKYHNYSKQFPWSIMLFFCFRVL